MYMYISYVYKLCISICIYAMYIYICYVYVYEKIFIAFLEKYKNSKNFFFCGGGGSGALYVLTTGKI